ncbi:MAG: RNA methyltransferase [Myxococcota bacterium]
MAEAFTSSTMASLARVSDPDDPRLDDYRAIRERRLKKDRQAFIAESEGVLRVFASSSRFSMRSVLIAENRLAKLADVLAPLSSSVPVYVAAPDVLDRIVGFHIHRGVLAAGQRALVPLAADLLASLPARRRHLVVALESLTNHDNVGGVFRNAAAFGASAVVFDHPTCDPLYRKAIRVSVGATLVVPWGEDPSSRTMLAALKEAGFAVWALTPRGAAEPLSHVRNIPERVALLAGTEGAGLSEFALDEADRHVRIEMGGDFDSLNVGTATGIALHHLSVVAGRK